MNISENNMLQNREDEKCHIPFGGNVTPNIIDSPKLENNNLKVNKIKFSVSSLSPSLSTVKPFNNNVLSSNINTINSSEEFKDPKSLLCKYRKESSLMSEIHNKSSEFCLSKNKFCTLFALTVTLLCSVADPILQKYAEDAQKIFTTASFAFIGGINVMFNFLAWQQKAELHKQARDSHRQIIEKVEMSFAYSAVSEGPYDFTKALNEISQIHTNLTKIAPPIPPSISEKYETILCPSLLKRELKDKKRKKVDGEEMSSDQS